MHRVMSGVLSLAAMSDCGTALPESGHSRLRLIALAMIPLIIKHSGRITGFSDSSAGTLQAKDNLACCTARESFQCRGVNIRQIALARRCQRADSGCSSSDLQPLADDGNASVIEQRKSCRPYVRNRRAQATRRTRAVKSPSSVDKHTISVYASDMRTDAPGKQHAEALFDLPCACQNLRRATRVVTRIYDRELAKVGIEITQFGLLTALHLTGEANQKRLSTGFAMDSTTLTRTLRLMLKQGWIRARRGKDKRERLFSLTRAGRRQLATAQPFWEAAQGRLRKKLGALAGQA